MKTCLYIVLLAAATVALAGACRDFGPAASRQMGNRREGRTRTVVDSLGSRVEIPVHVRRVVTVSDALVEEVMIVFGVEDRLAGIGSTCLIREFRYDYETASGGTFSHAGGMNPAFFLNRAMAGLPFFVRPGTEINFETLAALNPDVLILDLGSCTLSWRMDPRAMRQGLERLASLGIPTIVLKGPNAGGEPGVRGLSAVIGILGEVFDRPEQAAILARYLEDSIRLVIDRTSAVPDSERRSVLLLGLNPRLRAGGGVGQVSGTKDIQSFFAEEIVHAQNAYRGESRVILNFEQILALDPDAIVLPTANGYHPPRELLEGPYFQTLGHMRAIRNRRVGALPWSPCNCAKRLEYPIDVYIMAATVYPELFAGLDLSAWILDFYQTVYGVNRETALGLLRAQWLEWTLAETDEIRERTKH